MILRLLAIAALLAGAYTLLRRTGWSARERHALVIIVVATAIIVTGAVLLAMLDAR